VNSRIKFGRQAMMQYIVRKVNELSSEVGSFIIRGTDNVALVRG